MIYLFSRSIHRRWYAAHYWVYETSYALHRNLSPNNMWYRIGNEIHSILCNWDLEDTQVNGAASSQLPRATPLADTPTQTDIQPDSAVKPRYRTVRSWPWTSC